MRKFQFAAYALIGWYLLLIVVHYFMQRPLWNDEYWIYYNIHQRPGLDLFAAPLIEFQQFPRTYLYLIGQIAKPFNYSFLALRLLPFLCMFLAFLAWIQLAKRQIKDQLVLLTFILCWSASAPLIYYAAELKQYSMDVLTAVVFLSFLCRQQEIRQSLSPYGYLLLLALLPFLGLFSYPVFFFFALVMYNLAMDIRENKAHWLFLAVYTLSCLSVFAFIYYFDISNSNMKFLSADWGHHMISFESPGAFFKTLGENINNLISRWFVERPKWLRMLARFFVALGLIRLLMVWWGSFKKDNFRLSSIKSIAFVVFWEHFFLAVLKKYPFVEVRTSLFFAPMLLFLTADAIGWIKQQNKWAYLAIQYSFLAYLSYISLGLARIVFFSYLGAEPVIWQ